MCKITYHEFRGFTVRYNILRPFPCLTSVNHHFKSSIPKISGKGDHANLASEAIIGTLPSPLEHLILGNSSGMGQVGKDATNIY